MGSSSSIAIEPSRRALLMVRASMISDAAAMPLHWIYDQSKIQELIAGELTSNFYHTPSCPFYKYPAGELSPYGGESIPVLRALAKSGGLNAEVLGDEYASFFSTYDKEDVNGYVGRLNHVPKTFLESKNQGKPLKECAVVDSQAQGIAKVPIIVARYAGTPELSQKIEELVGILQDSKLSVEASLLVGKVLESILLSSAPFGSSYGELLQKQELSEMQKSFVEFLDNTAVLQDWVSFSNAVNKIPSDNPWRNMGIKSTVFEKFFPSLNLRTAIDATTFKTPEEKEVAETAFSSRNPSDPLPSPREVGAALGLSCALPNALLNSLFVVKNAKDLTEATHLNNIIGGDNCSRALVIGAIFGAVGHVEDIIPADWIAKVNPKVWVEIEETSQQIVAENPTWKN